MKSKLSITSKVVIFALTIVMLISNCSCTFLNTLNENQVMIAAMECWAEGNEYEGDSFYSWKDCDNKQVEEKAVEIVRELKTDITKLQFFLYRLQDKGYKKDSIHNELSNLNLTMDEKLFLAQHLYSYPEFDITLDDIQAYIKKHGTKTIYTESGHGGYYDGKKDSDSHHQSGLDGSPIYNHSTVEYHGDFKRVINSGVELDENYKESSYHNSTLYFKDVSLGFEASMYDCYYSENYFIGINEYEIYITDLENFLRYHRVYDEEAKKNRLEQPRPW